MKNAVFWDVMLCVSCKNRRFGGTFRLRHQAIVFIRSVLRLLVTAVVVPISPILLTVMMEAIGSSEKSILTRASRSNILRRRHFSRYFSVLQTVHIDSEVQSVFFPLNIGSSLLGDKTSGMSS
jgi:hypothetical protein